ncbi:hypothetical protein ACFL5Q_02965 [Planctomycetota bacterium]
MRRLPPPLAGLLASVVASCALAQLPEKESPGFEQPSPAVDLQPTWTESPGPLSGEAMATDVPADVETVIEPPKPDLLHGFLGYRCESNSADWIVGNGDQFGMFSLQWDHYRQPGANHGVGVGLQFHFLSGPVRTDMPPRVYDFSIGYQHRDRVGAFGYDVAVAVMASSDFEGSSREGIRFPGHAVGFLSIGPITELVFGVDYLDRGDVKLLPVVGLIALPHPDVRLDVVFPRPRVVFQLTDRHRLYAGGELGGGTWAVERATMVDDLATYRDLRLCVGLQRVDDGDHRPAVEISYLFDRRLEYTSGNGDFSPVDAVMIRLVDTF